MHKFLFLALLMSFVYADKTFVVTASSPLDSDNVLNDYNSLVECENRAFSEAKKAYKSKAYSCQHAIDFNLNEADKYINSFEILSRKLLPQSCQIEVKFNIDESYYSAYHNACYLEANRIEEEKQKKEQEERKFEKRDAFFSVGVNYTRYENNQSQIPFALTARYKYNFSKYKPRSGNELTMGFFELFTQLGQRNIVSTKIGFAYISLGLIFDSENTSSSLMQIVGFYLPFGSGLMYIDLQYSENRYNTVYGIRYEEGRFLFDLSASSVSEKVSDDKTKSVPGSGQVGFEVGYRF